MKKLHLVLLVVALAGFVYGLLHLFRLRFEAGDSYPEYSSLRADPLGSKALYESLGSLLSARRHFRSLARLGDGPGTTVLLLGLPAEAQLAPGDFKALETFARNGGRVVISLFPSFQPRWPGAFRTVGGRRGPPTVPPMPGGTNQPPGVPPPTGASAEAPIPLGERWGWKPAHAPLERDAKRTYQPSPAFRQTADSLPDELPTHTALFFDQLEPAWRVVFARRSPTNELPVLIERSMGRGTIVVAADSYPFSNEALRRERQSALLAWVVGPNPQVLFDEAHLGVQENPGIATLARQYRLGGFFCAALLLAGLFLWKNAVAFMPPYDEQLAREHGDHVEGRDSAGGFINLLRRNIKPVDLMKSCLAEWNAQFIHARKPPTHRLEAMQKLIDAENELPPRQRDPVRMYREFCRILAKKSDPRLP